MRTTFSDAEDKQLVQIAFQFEGEGLRITWSYVARQMAKSKRSGVELRLQLASLKLPARYQHHCIKLARSRWPIFQSSRHTTFSTTTTSTTPQPRPRPPSAAPRSPVRAPAGTTHTHNAPLVTIPTPNAVHHTHQRSSLEHPY
ncbi:hypothetical protein GQ600_11659 [Phytophthora cactorum]|nr:hypothetical protein GQ600_11659 [Phytophthora cactorum]